MPTAATRLVAGRYEVKRLLGSGGFAEVFLATDTGNGELVALKVFRDSSISEFSPAALEHRHIVRQLDEGLDGGKRFLVFEYVRGLTLRERLQAGPLTAAEMRRLACDLGSALEHAHSGGVVHGDVKPENVIMSAEGAKLIDFGAGRSLVDTLKSDEVRDVLGTLMYLAPEVVAGEAPGARSDTYSFGVLLLEAVCGRLPFGRPYELSREQVARLVPPTLGTDFGAILADALSPYSELRPGRVGELAEALAPTSMSPVVTERVVPTRATGSRGRKPFLAAASAAGLAILALFGPVAASELGSASGELQPRESLASSQALNAPSPAAPAAVASSAPESAESGASAAAVSDTAPTPSNAASEQTIVHGSPAITIRALGLQAAPTTKIVPEPKGGPPHETPDGPKHEPRGKAKGKKHR